MLKHNKKRNVGLLNEFFAQYMANAAVEFRFDDYVKAEKLWKKHFKENTELANELKMFEMISEAKLKDRNVAYDLLGKIKTLVKEQSQKVLDQEKTNLIHEIRNEINDDNFFERQISDYKTNASIQIVLNCWRNNEEKNSSNMSKISHLEETVLDHMLKPKDEPEKLDESLLKTSQEDIDKLVVNMFREKVKDKYEEQLNEDQREILGLYTFSNKNPESQLKLENKLKVVKKNVLDFIAEEVQSCDEGTKSKLLEVKSCLEENSFNVADPSKEDISFYLSVCSLKHELESTESHK